MGEIYNEGKDPDLWPLFATQFLYIVRWLQGREIQKNVLQQFCLYIITIVIQKGLRVISFTLQFI